MDPEARENVLNYGPSLIEVDTDRYRSKKRSRDPSRSRSPSWGRRSPSPPSGPRPPPPYRPVAEPDWGGEGGDEQAFEYVELDTSRRVLTAEAEREEEDIGRWASRKSTDPLPSIEDNDSSDDEYVHDNPRATLLRRRRMQQYRSNDWRGGRQQTLDELLEHPDIALQPRFNDLPFGLDEEMRKMALGSGFDTLRDEDTSWDLFWRLCDRHWCFLCRYRRTTESRNFSKEYSMIVQRMSEPLFDHDEEQLVDEIQNIFMLCIRPCLPPRKPVPKGRFSTPVKTKWCG